MYYNVIMTSPKEKVQQKVAENGKFMKWYLSPFPIRKHPAYLRKNKLLYYIYNLLLICEDW